MRLSKRTQLKHDKMIALAEKDIQEGKIHSHVEVEKIIQSWKKEYFELGKSLFEKLEIGEKSGFAEDFDAKENLKKLHSKYLTKGN